MHFCCMVVSWPCDVIGILTHRSTEILFCVISQANCKLGTINEVYYQISDVSDTFKNSFTHACP